MKEILQMKVDKTKEKGSQYNPEHAANKDKTLAGSGPPNVEHHIITMAKVAALPEQERAKAPKERFYTRWLPYPLRILSKPYPKRYEPWTFAQYDGKRESAIELVNKFINTLGPYMANKDLYLWEFSKSLYDCAYT